MFRRQIPLLTLLGARPAFLPVFIIAILSAFSPINSGWEYEGISVEKEQGGLSAGRETPRGEMQKEEIRTALDNPQPGEPVELCG